jgi:hypothetical protein
VQIPPIDAAASGTSFSRGARGQAIPSINEFRPPARIGRQMNLDVARGSSIRGVADGLGALLGVLAIGLCAAVRHRAK